MGRAPCCDKANVKKGPWSPEEDAKLKSFIEQNGTGGNWIALPKKIGLKRCGKSCRLRWLNYLRPNIKHGGFSEEEDRVICGLYVNIGSRWSIIAAQLPGRTDNDIKNYWNTRLKKKFMGKQRKEIQARRDRFQKQEMKKWSDSSTTIVSNTFNQTPYWPELPVLSSLPHSNEDPRSNNHDSIRKLLVKIGGRFADNDKILHQGINLQFPTQTTSINHVFEQSTDTFCETGFQFDQNQFAPDKVGLPLQEGQSSNGGEQLQKNVVRDSSKGLLGLEFLFEEEINGEGFSTTSCNWGEISSLISPYLYPWDSENFESSHGRIL